MMDKIYHAIVVLMSLLLISWPHTGLTADRGENTDKVIRFAPLPMASFEQVTREYLPFIDYLEKATGHPFELAWYPDYETLIDAVADGNVDLAYLGPLPYVAVTQKSSAIIPVVQLLDSQGRSDYTCSVVRFAETELSFTEPYRYDVALTQPLSTCGYLAMENYLHRQGLSLEDSPFQYEYSGSHSQVALDVILDKYQFGGMKTRIAERYHHLGLRIEDETEPVPGFVLVANQKTLADPEIQTIRDSMLTLNPRENPTDKETVKSWSRNLRYGAQPVDDAVYDSIRQQWYRLKISLIGATP